MVTPHRKCVRMLHPLLKIVFSSRLVSTLAITTHAPRCCEDCARLVADKLAPMAKSQKKPGGLRLRSRYWSILSRSGRAIRLTTRSLQVGKTFERVEDFRRLSSC